MEQHKITPMGPSKLPREIWALGFVSMLMDISSETIYGILPIFLVTALGATATTLGVLEGVAEGMALVVKVFSGPLSDWMKKRRPLLILGYGMGAMSKPFFAIATSIPLVFAARVFDRIGKGMRGAPRDALMADVTPPKMRGRAFGLRQSLDTTGAFLGPLLGIVLLALTHNNYRLIFWIATVPGILSVMLLYWGIKEKNEHGDSRPQQRIKISDIKNFHSSFWFVAISGAIFQLARFSSAFLILRGKDFGLGIEYAPVVLMVMNLVYAATSYPVGHWSDKIRREWFLILGFIALIIADLLLAFGQNLYVGLLGVAFWGLHLGLTQGTLVALVADTCPAQYRGTSYGIFNVFSAVALLLASTMAGILWDKVGPEGTFIVGAGIAFFSLLLFVVFKSAWSPTAETR